eukprot:6186512-Pleurochrysis_carterae.AAC.1
MHGEGSEAPGSWQPASARRRNSAVGNDEMASAATIATALHRSRETIRVASSNADTGPAPPVSIVRTRTEREGSNLASVAIECASIKRGVDKDGTAMRPSKSLISRPADLTRSPRYGRFYVLAASCRQPTSPLALTRHAQALDTSVALRRAACAVCAAAPPRRRRTVSAASNYACDETNCDTGAGQPLVMLMTNSSSLGRVSYA